MSIVTSDTIKAISGALLKFQGAVGGVGRASDNPFFHSRYANLETVVSTARPELQAVGIVFLQSGGAIVEGVMAMTTRLIHAESGEWIEATMDICLGKRDPQGTGSAQTFAQRYHLMAMLGLPPVDDDGETAIDRTNSRPVTTDSTLLAAISNSTTAAGLQEAFGEAWKSTADPTVRNAYKAAYEARKPAFSVPEDIIPYATKIAATP